MSRDYDVKKFNEPELWLCEDCKQAFVSADMYWEHREASDMDPYDDPPVLNAGDDLGALEHTLGYENCLEAQE